MTLPAISDVTATPTTSGATVNWTTDKLASSQLMYGLTSSYGASTTLNSMGVTSHSIVLSGLNSDTTYHFEVLSGDSSGMSSSSDQTFTTLTTSSSGGVSTTTASEIAALQQEIDMLQSRVSTLEAEVNSLFSHGSSGGNTGTTTPSGAASATIDQNGGTYRAGGQIDFGGHNFAHEENVVVTLNGVQVATAHADGGGNFSTGSLTLPVEPGVYTYVFTGQNSAGGTAKATITLH